MSSKDIMEQIKILKDRLGDLKGLKRGDPEFKETRRLWLADYQEFHDQDLHPVLQAKLRECFDDYLVWSREIDKEEAVKDGKRKQPTTK